MQRKNRGIVRRYQKRHKTETILGKAKVKRGIRQISQGQLNKIFAEQKRLELIKRAEKRAVVARKKFKLRKSDRGKIVLIGTDGKRNPHLKGRQGYPVYVTRTGKKWLVRVPGKPLRAHKGKHIQIPGRLKAAREFQRSELVTSKKGRALIKGSGNLDTGSSAYDFNAKVVNKLAKSLQNACNAQASQRRFYLTAMVTVRLPGGELEVFEISVKFERPDHRHVDLSGVLAFINKSFYAEMASQLARAGYVTSGSANHIRHLSVNAFSERNDWLDNRDESWAGLDKEIVRIIGIEWKIEQVK